MSEPQILSAGELVVEAGAVRTFAAATGSSHPAYVGPEPWSSPATFLITKRHWLDEADDPWRTTGLDRRRFLHAGEEYVFTGPPPAPGTRLTFSSYLEGVHTKPGRRGGELTFAVLATEFRDESGALRVVSRTTVVQPSHAPASEAAEPTEASEPTEPTEPAEEDR